MSDINSLIASHNIQGELIKNEIEQNNLMVEALKEQKYNELLKENNQLKERINKAIKYINKCVEAQLEEDFLMNRVHLMNYNCNLLDLLKGDKE